MARGVLIDIEGADSSGKATQTKFLAARLLAENHRDIALFSFPRYEDSRAGRLIGELLSGKHGDFMSMPPHVSALPYALDRAGAKHELDAALARGAVLVCDRYTPSNLAHQAAKLPEDEQDALIEFIEGVEYEDLQLPRPDIVLYLSVSTDISSELILHKQIRTYIDDGSSRDYAERNIAHQDRARRAYLRLARERSWPIIECVKDGAIRPPEDIHDDIWKVVQEYLPKTAHV